MKNKRFYFGLFIVASLFLLLCFLLFYVPHKESRQLRQVVDSFFREGLQKDSLSLHYTLSNPSRYGLEALPPSLPCFSEKELERTRFSLSNYKNKLLLLNPAHFNQEEALTYQNLLHYFETELDGCEFAYYSEPLAPNSGVQTQLLILLAEFRFNQKSDVDLYLSLLQEVDSYFKSIVLYEEKKAQQGLFMAPESMEKVILQCDRIITLPSLEDNSHFLIKTFQERIEGLVNQGVLSSSQAKSYLVENRTILLSQVYPAYVSLGDELFLLNKSGTNHKGLAYFPKGKGYYTYLAKSVTGSDKSIPELKKLLTRQLQEISRDISSVSHKLGALLPEQNNQFSTSLPLSDANAMLTDLQIKMEGDYPSFPISASAIAHTVKKVDESLENYVSPAFYLTPPIDNVYHNVIYINEKEPLESIDLYTTLAHEGYPGHLYQSVYYLLSRQKEKSFPIETLLAGGGYTEGWAYYVENNSYEYAKSSLSSSSEQEVLSYYFELCRLNRNLQLCLFSYLDISIHYDGFTFSQAKELLSLFGIKNEEGAQNVYRYIVEEPANYLKYCIGYLEILECRELAKKYWGTNYSPLKFHTLFLETGPCAFPLFKRVIKNSTYSEFVSAVIPSEQIHSDSSMFLSKFPVPAAIVL